jgi:hypothetical protein
MVQFSIVSGSLKITNANTEVSLLIAKKDVSCYSRSLYLEVPIVYLYNLNGGYNEIVFEMKLSECEDDTGTPFTIDSFLLFAEENLGFDSGAIPQTIGVVDNFSALPNPASVDGQFYWCENSEGVHLTGIYYSNGVSWETNEATEIKVVANYSALPDPTTSIGLFYWCEASQGTAWIWGSVGGTYYPSGTYYSNGVTWTYLKSPQQATQTEVDAGVNNDKFVTPNTLENFYKWANIESQIDAKQNALLSAYTVIANNTNASANGTSQTFKSIANQIYTGTPVWTGTTAPSGSTFNSYSWNQIGNLVTLRINLVYSVQGTSITSVTIPLPTDCPSPFVANGGAQTSNRLISVGTGIMQTNFVPSTVTSYVVLQTNSTNTGFNILVQRASASYQVATVMVTYLTT